MDKAETIDRMICFIKRSVVTILPGDIGDIGIEIEKYPVIIRLDFHLPVIKVYQEGFVGCQTPDEAGGRNCPAWYPRTGQNYIAVSW